MGQQQLGFDFFNEPAEEKSPVKKPVSREQALKEVAGSKAYTQEPSEIAEVPETRNNITIKKRFILWIYRC
ncbi:MAG: hypothetical protein EOO13_16315 [Chitinophagaceae bacterium]|nr:MAG: hypothetical protein EOO13_16315 [Chitinophagaceae bacterium]